MKRRIIRQGHNTLTVTLPSKWAIKNNIKPGDEVDISEKDNSLLINTEYQAVSSSIDLDITGLNAQTVWRFISSAYRTGYNEISVSWEEKDKKFSSPYTAFSYNTLNHLFNEKELSTIETIQALVNRFISVEIIDQKENKCVIKELSEISYKEFENSLRRIFLIILDMAEECSRAAKKEKSNIKAVHMVDTNLDRFEDFCLRVLNTRGYAVPSKTPVMHTILFMLEMLGDELKYIGLHLVELDKSGKNVSESLAKSMEKIFSHIREYYTLFYAFDKEKVLKIYENNRNYEEELKKIISNNNGINNKECKENSKDKENKDKEDAVAVHHLLKISKFISSLVELKIDLEN